MAVILAILYFGLIELLMIDASRALNEAQRFRARIIAFTLAENGAELVSAGIVDPDKTFVVGNADDEQGHYQGKLQKTAGGVFDIEAEGTTSGTERVRATVRMRGQVVGNEIKIDYTNHSQ